MGEFDFGEYEACMAAVEFVHLEGVAADGDFVAGLVYGVRLAEAEEFACFVGGDCFFPFVAAGA